MRTIVTAIMMAAALAWAAQSQAKRVGGGKTSGATREAAKPNKPKTKEEETKERSGPTIRVRTNDSPPSGAQPAGLMRTAVPQPGGAALPVAAGVAAGSSAGLDAEELQRRNEERLRRAGEEDEKKRAEKEKRDLALADWERRQAEERKRLDKEREERNAKAKLAEQQSQCVFKAVMTDDDIAKCRSVRR